MIDTEIQHDHFKEIYSVWGYGYKVPSLKMKLSSPCLAVIFLGSIPVIIAKQPKEAIHLSLKVKDGVKTYKFQILIIFRIDGDPSIYFGEGLYLENDKVLMRISHRDSEWESTIEKCCSSLSGWDKKAHSSL